MEPETLDQEIRKVRKNSKSPFQLATSKVSTAITNSITLPKRRKR